MRNAIRDFFRRRRLAKHTALHGDRYFYHGVDVEIPARFGLGPRNALLRGKYEPEEAALVERHLPRDLPVIELGGSLGVISRFIGSRIDPTARHIVVEANGDLVEVCAANASRGRPPGMTEVVEAAIWHDGPVARFRVGRNVHSSMIAWGEGEGEVFEVAATTLAALHARMGLPERFALVSDCEGGEYGIFEREQDVLRNVAVAIVEIHPRKFEMAGVSEAAFLAMVGKSGFRIVERVDDVIVLDRL